MNSQNPAENKFHCNRFIFDKIPLIFAAADGIQVRVQLKRHPRLRLGILHRNPIRSMLDQKINNQSNLIIAVAGFWNELCSREMRSIGIWLAIVRSACNVLVHVYLHVQPHAHARSERIDNSAYVARTYTDTCSTRFPAAAVPPFLIIRCKNTFHVVSHVTGHLSSAQFGKRIDLIFSDARCTITTMGSGKRVYRGIGRISFEFCETGKVMVRIGGNECVVANETLKYVGN